MGSMPAAHCLQTCPRFAAAFGAALRTSCPDLPVQPQSSPACAAKPTSHPSHPPPPAPLCPALAVCPVGHGCHRDRLALLQDQLHHLHGPVDHGCASFETESGDGPPLSIVIGRRKLARFGHGMTHPPALPMPTRCHLPHHPPLHALARTGQLHTQGIAAAPQLSRILLQHCFTAFPAAPFMLPRRRAAHPRHHHRRRPHLLLHRKLLHVPVRLQLRADHGAHAMRLQCCLSTCWFAQLQLRSRLVHTSGCGSAAMLLDMARLLCARVFASVRLQPLQLFEQHSAVCRIVGRHRPSSGGCYPSSGGCFPKLMPLPGIQLTRPAHLPAHISCSPVATRCRAWPSLA